jgi:hypothetical protein
MSPSIRGKKFIWIALAALGVWLALMIVAAAAHASCSYPNAEQVFAEYGDNAYYELAPDGGLEGGGTGWEFTGDAELITGDETSTEFDSADQVELSIPYGATAISPRFCVDETTPHFRLMTINSGKKDTRLKVRVLYEYLKDDELRTDSKNYDIRSASSWGPSQALELKTDHGQERVARISFTPKEREGAWLIDDLYIDPFARR